MIKVDSAVQPWLVIIDPQRIFADSASDWCAHQIENIFPVIDSLLPQFAERVVITRWVPPERKEGSWEPYFRQWEFADLPPEDPYLELVERAKPWVRNNQIVSEPTFGKWGKNLQQICGRNPHLLICGVATDCCVITTALAAADSGAWVQVIADGCAGSSPENHRKALELMELYAPQIEVLTAADYLRR